MQVLAGQGLLLLLTIGHAQHLVGIEVVGSVGEHFVGRGDGFVEHAHLNVEQPFFYLIVVLLVGGGSQGNGRFEVVECLLIHATLHFGLAAEIVEIGCEVVAA